MALTDKLSAIADAIREKTGKTATMTLDQMPTEIASIESGGGTTTSGDIDAFITGTISEISSNVTTVHEYAFYGFGNLKTANLPLATSIGDRAFYESYLQTINAPLVTEIGDYSFGYCRFSTVNFPNVTSIGTGAFMNGSLTTADFPLVTTINSATFNGCTNLTTINFPKATTIGGTAFNACKYLVTADFPLVTSIGSSAFGTCSRLTALILRNSSVCTLSNTSALSNTPIKSGTGYIYVPSTLVDSYKAATNWSTYAAQIRAIEDYPDITGG